MVDDPTDVDQAKTWAEMFFRSRGLGAQTEVEKWNSTVQRCWALLSRTYDEIAAAGRFAFRHDENAQETYPSLISSARSGRRRRAEIEEADVVEEPMGGDEEGAGEVDAAGGRRPRWPAT